jgi:hypothetical protein
MLKLVSYAWQILYFSTPRNPMKAESAQIVIITETLMHPRKHKGHSWSAIKNIWQSLLMEKFVGITMYERVYFPLS